MVEKKTDFVVPKQVLPWERQPNETEQAFEAFKVFRDLDPTLRTKAEASKRIEKSINLIQRWASQWEWDVRVREYDNYMQNLMMADRVKAIKEMNQKHLKIAYALQRKAAQALQQVDVERLAGKPDEVLRWFTEAVTLERKIMLQPEMENEQHMLNSIKQEEQTTVDEEKRLQAIKDTVDALREAGLLDRIIPTGTAIEAEYRITEPCEATPAEKDKVHATEADAETDGVSSDGQHT